MPVTSSTGVEIPNNAAKGDLPTIGVTLASLHAFHLSSVFLDLSCRRPLIVSSYFILRHVMLVILFDIFLSLAFIGKFNFFVGLAYLCALWWLWWPALPVPGGFCSIEWCCGEEEKVISPDGLHFFI